jgi:hypothetical protein
MNPPAVIVSGQAERAQGKRCLQGSPRLEIQEVKTVPYAPLSHPFVERIIGTIRRECLDHTVFWTTADLEAKLSEFRDYYNHHRTHTGRAGTTPAQEATPSRLDINSYRWRQHCRGLYQTPMAA